MSFGIGQPGAGMNGILAAATANVLGGVKIGANVSVATDGTISVAAGPMQTPWVQNVNAAGFTLSNVPTVSGNGNITLAAGGAGNVILQTSAKTRLVIDGSGNAILNANDSGAGSLTLGGNGGATLLYTVSTNELDILTNGALVARGQAGFYLQTGASNTTRANIDSAGHVIVAAPDDGASGLRTNTVETTAYAQNAYNPGSGWVYRAANLAAFLLYPTATGVSLLVGSAGTAGAAVTWSQPFSFIPGANPLTVSALPFAAALPASPIAALESQMPNMSLMVCANTNTLLIFRFKGSDGVMRQATLTAA